MRRITRATCLRSGTLRQRTLEDDSVEIPTPPVGHGAVQPAFGIQRAPARRGGPLAEHGAGAVPLHLNVLEFGKKGACYAHRHEQAGAINSVVFLTLSNRRPVSHGFQRYAAVGRAGSQLACPSLAPKSIGGGLWFIVATPSILDNGGE